MKKRASMQFAVAVVLGLLTFSFAIQGSEVRAVNAIQAVDISVGGETSRGYACSILVSHEVLCWGSAPIVGIVPGIDNAVGIASGVGHTCALLRTKTVKCWGGNGSGQLGDGTQNNRTSPVSVVGVNGTGTLSDIEFIAASAKRDITCAINGSGRALCWGNNGNGAVGDPSVSGSSSTPVYVIDQSTSNPLTDVATMAVGTYTTCAVKSTGAAFCWGDNGLGQLGNSSTGSTSAAVPVMGVGGTGFLTDATQVALGDAMGCARRSNGAVACWGMNYLGNGSSGGSSTPVAVSGVTNALQVATAEENACVLLATGDIKCWGNWHGNSGASPSQQVFATTTSPGGTALLTNARRLATGGGWQQKYCAILNNDAVRCWGANNSGALGVDSTATPYSNVPIEPQQSFTMGPVTTAVPAPTTAPTTAPSTAPTTAPTIAPTVAPTTTSAVGSTSSTSIAVTSTVAVSNDARGSNVMSATTIAQGQRSVARVVTTTTTPVATSVVTTTTAPLSKAVTKAPAPASVEVGQAVLTKNGKDEQLVVTRETNKVVMSSGQQKAAISILDSSGNRKPLSDEGTIELSSGSTIEVELAGFVPGENCSVWMYSTATPLGESVVDENGALTGRFALPQSIEAGDHRIVVSVGSAPNTSTQFTLGVTYSEVSKSSMVARILITVPIALAVCAGLLLPNQVRRRLRRKHAS